MKKLLLSLVICLSIACTCDPPVECNNVTVDFTETIGYTGQVIFTGNSGQGTFVFDSANNFQCLPDIGTYQICFSSTWPGITALEGNTQWFSSKPCPQNATLESIYYLYPYPGD